MGVESVHRVRWSPGTRPGVRTVECSEWKPASRVEGSRWKLSWWKPNSVSRSWSEGWLKSEARAFLHGLFLRPSCGPACLEEPSGYRGQPYFEAVCAASLDAALCVCLRGHLCAADVSRTAVPPVPPLGLRQISHPACPNAPFFRAWL